VLLILRHTLLVAGVAQVQLAQVQLIRTLVMAARELRLLFLVAP
jgi:hypothetical protein